VTEPLDALLANVDRAWLVGGAMRDRLLARSTADYDVVVVAPGGLAGAARALATGAGGAAFALSEEFGAWRVVAHDRSWQVDLTALDGDEIEADLRRRDLTVNAIAQPLGIDDAELIDPLGGVDDLHARTLRAASAQAFELDPLRALRLARLACELGFTVEHETLALARRSAPELSSCAAERVFEASLRAAFTTSTSTSTPAPSWRRWWRSSRSPRRPSARRQARSAICWRNHSPTS
jgi:poly(A) polymerase